MYNLTPYSKCQHRKRKLMTFSQIDKYHGVVCGDCNPYIDPLLVINKVLGYRTFFMCVAEDSVANRSPNEFKEQWTENAICRREEELNNKVKGSSFVCYITFSVRSWVLCFTKSRKF